MPDFILGPLVSLSVALMTMFIAIINRIGDTVHPVTIPLFKSCQLVVILLNVNRSLMCNMAFLISSCDTEPYAFAKSSHTHVRSLFSSLASLINWLMTLVCSWRRLIIPVCTLRRLLTLVGVYLFSGGV